MLAGRVMRTGAAVTLAAATAVAAAGQPWNALALTVAATAAMINALLLESVLGRVLQPGAPHMTRGAAAVLAARWGVWVGLFVVWYLLRQRIALWAVAAGVTCYLAALGIAGASSDPRGPRKG